jgi:hypothetical protein
MFSHMSRTLPVLKIARVAAPAVAVVTFVLAVACTDQSPTVVPTALLSKLVTAAEGTFYGPVVPLGPGNARTYITIRNGTPVELGVEMNEGALKGLPTDGEHDGHNNMNHRMEDMFDLPLPAEAGGTVYKTVNLGWMPEGHGAPYNKPHFDFHFYTITEAERQAISPADPEWATKAGSFPAPAFWPERYYPLSMLVNVPPPAVAVPFMGVHWLDVASPELHGAEFTHTLFYGSWNGAIIFAEPMITKATLESRVSIDKTLPEAPSYMPAGLHAGGYRVYYDESRDRHRVALTQFVARN